MKRKMVSLVLAASVLAVSAAGCGKLDGNAVVAEVGDAKITADVANFYARYQQAQYETYYASYLGEDMWTNEADEGKTYEDSIKGNILETLETMYVLDAHKADYNIELTEDEENAIKKAAKNFVKTNGADELDLVSGDEETAVKVLELMTIQQKMWDPMIADVDTEVSDEEAAQKSMQYVAFPFTTTDDSGNSVQLSEDEIAALKEKAESFRSGAESAEDFAAYAKEAGYEASTATFDKETTSPSQLLVAAADALEEGQLTAVIEDTNGYYVAKLTSLLDRDATDQKKESIVAQRQSEKYNSLCEEWKTKAKIKVHDKVWSKISFAEQGVTLKDTADGNNK